jgi:hypothetical protein
MLARGRVPPDALFVLNDRIAVPTCRASRRVGVAGSLQRAGSQARRTT